MIQNVWPSQLVSQLADMCRLSLYLAGLTVEMERVAAVIN
jgi:hypothetical protein